MQIHSILFETTRFNCSEVKPHFINDCCFGEDLAAWLRDQLSLQGIPARAPYQEDWGWEFSVQDAVGSYYIGAGGHAVENSSDQNRGEWRLMISKRRSLFQKLTGKNKLSKNEPIIAVVLSIVRHEPDFSNLQEESYF
jgi:hypothetical protein